MNAVGIIVEYNPLHNGHIHHIKEAKRLTNADVVIAVISSNFTQRGEPAIIDKKSRTISALENGVDLVVELPFLYSVESPNMFAFGALSILNDLGVKNVVFGIDEYDTKTFMETCEKKQFSSPRLDEMIQEYISKGYAYSEAKSLGLQAINDFYLELPNDILGYAIIKTINEQKMNITPIAIPRTIGYKDDVPNDNFLSSIAIRNLLKNHMQASNYSPMNFDDKNLHFLDDYFLLIKYNLLTFSSYNLRANHLVFDGIENLMKNSIVNAQSMDEFLSICTSKRYSKACISRALIHILCNTNAKWAAETLAHKPPYIRILGHNSNGRKYLSTIRKDCPTPILNRFKGQNNDLLHLELVASNVYYALENEPLRTKHQSQEINDFPIKIG